MWHTAGSLLDAVIAGVSVVRIGGMSVCGRCCRPPPRGIPQPRSAAEFERLISDYSRQQEAAGKPFNLGDFFAHMNESGTIPFSLIEAEMVASPLQIDSAERR
jgi:hypothetical protein